MAGKKLLVADDSLTIQKVIRLALSNEGYEIQAVSDGNDAIQQISLFRPDAVLVDVSLPGKTAFEVKRAINEHADLEEVRFILMSSAFEKVDEAQAAEVRFHGRLTKPFDPAHLRQVLSDTLAQVAAMRREPTSILQRPAPPQAAQPAAQPAATPTKPAAPVAPSPTRAPSPAPSAPATAPAAAAMVAPPLPVAPPLQLDPQGTAPAIPLGVSDADSLGIEVSLDLSVNPPAPHDEPVVGDDWLAPVQPNEPIVAPPPPAESINQLWDNEPTLSTDVAAARAQQQQQAAQTPAAAPKPAATRTPPPPSSPVSLDPAPHGNEPDADIRHLTESTIRMSGLDDFNWSVNEPSLKPPAQMLSADGSTFQLDTGPAAPASGGIPPFKPDFVPEIANVAEAASAPEVESPSLSNIPTPVGQMQSAASPSDFYQDPADVTKKLTRPLPFTPPPVPPGGTAAPARPAAAPTAQAQARMAPPPPLQGAMVTPFEPPHAGGGYAEASVVGIQPDQIEELLRKELQKLLPDLAEKLIKQEIHRMLSGEGAPGP